MTHATSKPPADLAAVAVLIPAWQPGRELLMLLDGLVRHGFGAILVVDDGSCAESQHIFQHAATVPRVQILRHAVNLGKGRSLKTGINHFLNVQPSFSALVTADADGQHRLADIAAVGQVLCAERGEVVLGVRAFAGEVPLRSRLGNLLSRQVFALLTGARLRDTQTGLRGFPRELLPNLLQIEGERYEYEMAVLAHLCRRTRKLTELPIETVYLSGNCSSHFRPVRDSIRIGRSMARLTIESLT